MTKRVVHLKRPVLIAVDFVREQHVPRGMKPACWRATVTGGGPRRSSGTLTGSWAAEGATREEAVQGLLASLQRAGYTGVARMVGEPRTAG